MIESLYFEGMKKWLIKQKKFFSSYLPQRGELHPPVDSARNVKKEKHYTISIF